jgi:hypothetical protein
MATSSLRRTEQSTPSAIHQRIRRETEARLARTLHGGLTAIEARLRELDQEWDTERVLEALAAGFTLTGILLGGNVDRRWYALPAVVSAFLLQHAIQGWCPPLPVIRALGVRTIAEIDEERYALKAARGDFDVVRSQPLGKPGSRTLLAAVTR